ncbi:hypothetical protein ACFE04_018828 [Oxalis oulophora]
MQCPNCRKVDKGQWLFANGTTRSLPEFALEDSFPDEDFYGLNFAEMPFRVHWCPFGDLARIGSSFEEMETPLTACKYSTLKTVSLSNILVTIEHFNDIHYFPDNDFRGHHPLFSEHTATPPYIAYVGVGPMPPAATARSSDHPDDPSRHPWNTVTRQNYEMFGPLAFPASAINIQYQSWGRHSPPFSLPGGHVSGADPGTVLPQTLRPNHVEPDAATQPRPFSHPLVFNHGSIARVGTSFISSAVPRHPGSSAQTHERIQMFHHQPQPSNTPGMPSPMVPSIRRFEGPRGLPAGVPAASQPDQNGGFFVLPPNEAPNPFLQWERQRLPRIIQREAASGSFHQSSSGSETGNRSSNGFWPRH